MKISMVLSSASRVSCNQLLASASLLLAGMLPAHVQAATLINTELTLSTLAQLTPTSPAYVTSFPRTVTVSATDVEFPDVSSYFNLGSPVPPGFAESLVNTAIDAQSDYITIGFGDAGSGLFASGFNNTYVFQFDSIFRTAITGITIDPSTNLGLTTSDVTFDGNKLFVNVESLPFTSNSFARINLDLINQVSAVPEPATWAMMLVGFGAIGGVMRRQRHQLRCGTT